jgi:protein SCO1/2
VLPHGLCFAIKTESVRDPIQGPAWVFLTGKKEDVTFILNKLGQAVAKRDDHLTTFVIGGEATGQWAKASGLADPAKVLALVDKILNEPDGN